jgi:hypothetical protein
MHSRLSLVLRRVVTFPKKTPLDIPIPLHLASSRFRYHIIGFALMTFVETFLALSNNDEIQGHGAITGWLSFCHWVGRLRPWRFPYLPDRDEMACCALRQGRDCLAASSNALFQHL